MILNLVINRVYTIYFNIIYKKSFKGFGKQSRIIFPLNINGFNNISIGRDVYVAYKSWLSALPLTGEKNCELIIGDGTSIGNFNHIYATKSVVIGKKVLTADRVYISDNLHSFEDINIPIIDQPIKQIKIVEIGDGTWLGENVCVIGAKIGKNCVVGANSVVTKDVPDYCVAVGSPAYIIKRFCTNNNIWKKTDKRGDFV